MALMFKIFLTSFRDLISFAENHKDNFWLFVYSRKSYKNSYMSKKKNGSELEET